MIGVDANILLDLLEKRDNSVVVRQAISGYRQAGESLSLSALTVSHVFYLAESHKVPMSSVELLISSFETYDVIPEDVGWALKNYAGKDFEDALQVAAAKRSGATEFLTLDSKLAKKYQKFLPIMLAA